MLVVIWYFGYLLAVGVTRCGLLILTDVAFVLCTLFEAAVLCYDEFGAGGTCGGVIPAQLLCCGCGWMLSWSLSFTGLLLVLHCKMNGYLFQCKIFTR